MATEHLTRAELGRALGLEAGDVPLPVSARSLTRREMLLRDWREMRWIVPAYLLLIVAAAATVALADTIPDRVRWLPLAFAAGAVALGLFAWLRMRRRWRYDDPMIAVDVAEDAVTLRTGGDTVVKPYEALNVRPGGDARAAQEPLFRRRCPRHRTWPDRSRRPRLRRRQRRRRRDPPALRGARPHGRSPGLTG